MATVSTPQDLDALWNFDQPEESEARFRAARAGVEATGDRALLAELLTQLARTQSLQQRFEEADALLDEAELLLAGMTAPRPWARIWLERGRTRRSGRQPELARPLFERAFETARDAALDALAVDAAHMAALVASGPENVTWHETAIALAEASQDPRARKWLGSLYNNLGWSRHDAGELVRALDLFERAEAFRAVAGEQRPHEIARWTVARCKRSLGRFDEALKEQQGLLQEMTGQGREDDGYVQEELGELLLALGQASEAAPHFQAAYKLLAEDIWLKRDQPERLARLQALGGV